jgi:hypothetical protein
MLVGHPRRSPVEDQGAEPARDNGERGQRRGRAGLGAPDLLGPERGEQEDEEHDALPHPLARQHDRGNPGDREQGQRGERAIAHERAGRKQRPRDAAEHEQDAAARLEHRAGPGIGAAVGRRRAGEGAQSVADPPGELAPVGRREGPRGGAGQREHTDERDPPAREGRHAPSATLRHPGQRDGQAGGEGGHGQENGAARGHDEPRPHQRTPESESAEGEPPEQARGSPERARGGTQTGRGSEGPRSGDAHRARRVGLVPAPAGVTS